MQIPNQNNISDIIKSQIDQMDDVFHFLNDVSARIKNSEIINIQSVSNIQSATSNTIRILQSVIDALFDIKQVLFEMETVQKSLNLSTILGDRKSFINFIKTGKLESDNNYNTVLEQYLSLLEFSKKISDISADIKARNINRAKRAIIKTLNMMGEIIVYIYKQGIFSKLADNAFVEITLKSISSFYNKLIDLLSDTIKRLLVFGKTTRETRKNIKRSVKSIFSLFYSILWNTIGLNLFLKFYGVGRMIKNIIEFSLITDALNYIMIHSQVLIDSIIKIGSNKMSVLSGVKLFKYIFKKILSIFINISWKNFPNIIGKLLLIDTFILPMLAGVFNKLDAIIDELIKLGDNYFKARAGIDALTIMFVGSRLQLSIFDIFRKSNTPSILKMVDILMTSFLMNMIFINLSGVIDLIIKMGENYFAILKGRRSLKIILLGGVFRKSIISILSQTSKHFKDLVDAAPTIILISILMSLLTPVINLLILTGRNYRRVRRGIRAIKYIFRHLIWVIRYINSLRITDILKTIPIILSINLIIVLLGIGVMALASISFFIIPAIMSIIGMITIIFLIRILIHFISGKPFQKKISEGLISAGLILAVIGVLGYVLMQMDSLRFDFVHILAVMGVIILLTISVLLVSLLALITPTLGLIKIVIIIGLLLPAAILLEKISNLKIAAKQIGIFATALISIIGVAVLIGLIALILPLAIIGVIMLSVFMVGLMIVSLSLILLAAINIGDLKQAEKNAEKVFNTCENIINHFTKRTKKPNKSESWVLGLIRKVGGNEIASVINSIMAVAYLAFMLFSIFSIMLIAGMLEILADMKIDETKVSATVDSILNCVGHISHVITDTRISQSHDDSQSWFRRVLFLLPLGSDIGAIIDGVLNFAYVAFMLITIGMVSLIAVNLKYLGGIKIDSEAIQNNIKSIMSCAFSVGEAINEKHSTSKKENASWWKKALNSLSSFGMKIKGMIEAVMNVGNVAVLLITIGIVRLLADNLNYIGKISFDKNKVLKKTDDIIGIAKELAKKVGEEDFNLEDTFDGVDDFAKFVGQTAKLVNNINKINISKINSLSKMFGQAAAFSKSMNGNIDKLADAISKKLEPILKELTDAINNADKHIEERAKNRSENSTPTNIASAARTAFENITSKQKPQTITKVQPSKAQQAAQASQQKQFDNNQLAEAIADALMQKTLKVQMV